jgi:hypothetical protein
VRQGIINDYALFIFVGLNFVARVAVLAMLHECHVAGRRIRDRNRTLQERQMTHNKAVKDKQDS